jgi:hypothetical protein
VVLVQELAVVVEVELLCQVVWVDHIQLVTVAKVAMVFQLALLVLLLVTQAVEELDVNLVLVD